MNILFSVPRLHTNYAAMIQGLVEDGHKVSFIAMDGGDVTVPSNHEVPVYHIRSKKRWFTPDNYSKKLHFESFKKLKRILREQKPDLIIARDLLLLNIQISLTGRLMGIPTLYYDQLLPSGRKSLKGKLWYGIVHTFISRYRITTVKKPGSDPTIDKYTFFIPFAVPCTPVKHSYPEEFSVERPLKIIVVSKLGMKRKNLLFLLEALLPFFEKKIIQLSIYGVLRDDQESNKNFRILTEFIKIHRLSKFVDFHQNKSHQEVLSAYSEHDLFILPSLDEPAAISPFEAMSSGLPVIVTEQNGTNYVIEPNKTGIIFDPYNMKELQENIRFFIKRPVMIKEFGKKALLATNELYRPSHFSNNLIKAYQQI